MAVDTDKILSIGEVYLTSAPGPLDYKLAPVETFSDLASIKRSTRYEGMTVVVLKPTPTEYWLVGGTTNASWKVKRSDATVATYADLAKLVAGELYKGLEITVTEDETNDGQVTKYWLTGFDEEGLPIWTRKEYGANVTVTGSGSDEGSDVEHEQ